MFDIFRSIGLRPKLRPAAKRELREIDRSIGYYDNAVDEALNDARLSKASKRFLRKIWYGEPSDQALSWANREVRRAATVAAVVVCLDQANAEKDARRGKRRFRLLTTSPELGITSYDRPILNISAVGRHFDQAMRAAGAEGLGFLDIALFQSEMDRSPSQASVHMHAAIQLLPRSSGPRAAERCASPRNRRTSLGGTVIKITGKSCDKGKSLTPKQVAHLTYYASKISCGIKRTISDHSRTETSLQSWGMTEALRQLELYSHCDALQVVRGVGETGSQLRKQWKELLRRALELDSLPWGPKLDHAQLERDWAKVWYELALPLRAAKALN